MSQNNPSTPGARESNAGDEFHVLWAARRAVQLLNPRSGLQRVFMEGVSQNDANEIDDDLFLGVDLSEYYGGDKFETAGRVEVSQLKYSTRHPGKVWTASRLCVSKSAKGTDSVIQRLASIYKGFFTAHQREDVLQKLSIRLVSNQPVADDLICALQSAQSVLSNHFATQSAQVRQLLKLLSESEQAVIQSLSSKAGLSSTEFTDFLRVFDLSHCGEESRKIQRLRLIQDLSPSVSHDPVATLRSLCELIAHEAQPEREGSFGLTVEDIVACLGAGHRDHLFPAPSRLEAVKRPVSTPDAQNLASVLISANNHKVLAHGSAGVGKTTTVQTLVHYLPPQSIVIIYDCYGGGEYKIFGEQRHTPQRAFLQLTNELAVYCGSPFLIQAAQNIPDLQRDFKKAVEMAARILAEQGGLLVIAIDAVDNAITAAIENGDEKSCFVPDLWTINLPENCRLLMTARSHRRDYLQPPAEVIQHSLQGFNGQASLAHLQYVFSNADERSGAIFHSKTSGNPRVQSYLLDEVGSGNLDSTALEQMLSVAQRTPNQIFSDLLESALRDAGKTETNRQKLATLVYLNRPVPLHIFAGTCDIGEDEARRFCQALEPGTILRDNCLSFRDEDFETYLRDQIPVDEITSVQTRLGTYFLEHSTQDDYAARAVAEHLFLAECYQEVIDLAINGAELLPMPDELMRSQIQQRRIALAMQAVCKLNFNAEAVRLVLLAAEAARSNSALKALVRRNPELAAKYGDTASIARFYQQESDRWMGAIHFRTAAMYARDPSYHDRAEEHLRSAHAWVRRLMALPEQERHGWNLSDFDIACGAEAIFWLKGAQDAQSWLSQWRPISAIVNATEHLARSLVIQTDTTQQEQLLDELQLPLWAEALFLAIIGKLNAGLSIVLVEQLDHTLATLDAIIQRNRKYRKLKTEWAISLCELAARHGLDPERTFRLIDAVCPKMPETAPYNHIDLPKYDPPLRAAYLKAALCNTTLVAEELLPERYRQQERNAHQHESERRRFHDIVGKVLNVYAIRAQTIINQVGVADIAETLLSDLKYRQQESEHRWFKGNFQYGVWAEAACEALLNCADDASEMLHEITDAAERIMRGAAPKFWTGIAKRLLCHGQQYQLLGFQLLERAANYVMEHPYPGQDRWEMLLTCAEIVSPHDATQGQDYYKRSLAAADRIDDDSIHLLSFQADLACRVAQSLTDEERQDFAVRLASTVTAFEEYVSEASELPWEKTITAVTRLDPTSGMALCSQWDDENHISLEAGIVSVIREAVQSQFLKPFEGFALLRLAGERYDISETAVELLEQLRLQGVAARPQLVQLLKEASFWIRRDVPSANRKEAATRILNWVSAHRLEQFAGIAELREMLSLIESTLTNEKPDEAYLRFSEIEQDSSIQDLINQARSGNFENLDVQLQVVQQHSYSEKVPDFLNTLGNSVLPSRRVEFLNVLISLDLTFSTVISVVEFLQLYLEKWKGSPQIQAWIPEGVTKLLENNLPSLLIPPSRKFGIGLERILRFPPLKQTQPRLVLPAVIKHMEAISPEELYRVAKCIAPAVIDADIRNTFEWSLQRIEAQIAREERTFAPPILIASLKPSEALAHFLWALFGHPDKCVRWRALHTARAIAIQPNQTFVDTLIQLSTTQTATGFRSERLEFYWMSARTWLMLLLQRLADECPQVLQPHAYAIAAHALDCQFPHAQIRELAKRTVLRLVKAVPGCLSPEIVKQLHFANSPTACLYPINARYERSNTWRQSEWSHSKRRFDFDEFDTIPYWYNPASNVFAHAQPDVTRRSEKWICDVWGRTNQDWHDDVRELRDENDRQRMSNRQGTIPELENLQTYLEYHAMFCAAGEMVDELPIDGDTFSDVDCPWLYWLERHLNSSSNYWVADLRSPTPLRPEYWGQFPETDIKQWLQHKGSEEFDLALGLTEESRLGEIVVLGNVTIRDWQRSSSLSVTSALVNPVTARSLLQALQTTNPNDFQLPVIGRGVDDFEIDELGFELIAWMKEVRSRDETLDSFDPLSRDRGFSLETFQPHFVETMKLQSDLKRTQFVTESGEIAAVLEMWSDNLGEQHISHPFSSGERWWVRIDVLLDYLCQCDRDLIIEVQIRHNRNERSQREEGEDYDLGQFRIYLLRQNGILETLDSHRNLRATNCQRTGAGK
jgi:hypothetical protein